jgi:molybdate transport system regulatory protein
MNIKYKIWLDSDGKVFGEGPYHLLKLVDKTGSLHQAAMEMKMSYRKAWLTLQATEKRLGYTLIRRRVGGVSGGGSDLTEEARKLMEQYEAFHKEAVAALDRIYRKHFG